MATETDRITLVQTDALVKITEMDHIVLRNKDVETSLRFYVEVLGLKPERVEQWRAGEVRFPSARLNDDTSAATKNPPAKTARRTRTTSDHRFLRQRPRTHRQRRREEPGPLLHGY